MPELKAKILFLTTQVPFPPMMGGIVKSWYLVQYLSANYDLFVGTLLKEDDAAKEEHFQKAVSLSGYFSDAVHIPRSPITLFNSYRQRKTLNIFRNHSDAMHKQVKEWAPKMDIIFVDHYEMFQFVPEDFTGKVVLHEHNAEFVIWERFAEITNNPIKKLVLRNEAKRVKKAEAEICERADQVHASSNDQEKLASIGVNPEKFRLTLHLGDTSLLELPDLKYADTELALLFVGTLTWEPNVDGLIWFLEECWPQLKADHPDLTFYIAGKNPDPRILETVKGDKQIVVTGFVDDLEEYHKKCRVSIAPLRFGSGVKIKVMNSLHRGMPQVTTTIGREGIEVKHDKNILITRPDEPGLFRHYVEMLLTDQELWKRLSQQSRKLAKTKYSWEAHLVDFESYLKELLS